MAGKQAKILSEQHVETLLQFVETTRYPIRNRVIILLSLKAGLRAAEIANLTSDMLLTPTGELGLTIELRDGAAKMGHGRIIPVQGELSSALLALSRLPRSRTGPVVVSERGAKMTALSIVVWFHRAYHYLGLEGCSSHSGRRTFITRAARLVHKAGGSLRDVQLLAGHSSIQTTQRYIEGDSDVQRRLIALL